MDQYAIRDEFLLHRDQFFRDLLFTGPEEKAKLLASNKDLNYLSRYETLHEQFVYLTSYNMLLSLSNLFQSAQIVREQMFNLIDENNMDLDLLDQFSVGNYYHMLALTSSIWVQLGNQFNIKQSVQYFEKALECFKKAKHEDRVGLMYLFLGYANADIGDMTKAVRMIEQGITYVTNATNIPVHRKSELMIRYRGELVLLTFYLSPMNSEKINNMADILYHEVVNHDFENQLGALEGLHGLIEIYIELKQLDKARTLLSVMETASNNLTSRLLKMNFFTPLHNNEHVSIVLYRNVIALHDPNMKISSHAYLELDKLSSTEWINVQSTISTLQFQIRYLLGVYRGFNSIETLSTIQEKTNKLINVSLDGNLEFGFLTANLFKVRIFMIEGKKQEALDLLNELDEKYRDIKPEYLSKLVNRELNEISSMELSTNYMERVNQLKIEKYIQDSKILLSEIQQE